MKKKLITAISAIVLFGILIGIYVIAPSPDENVEPAPFIPPVAYDFLVGRSSYDVTSLAISRDDFHLQLLRMPANEWQTVGIYIRLDQNMVRAFNAELIKAVITHRILISDLAATAEYGLYPAHATITFTYNNGDADVIHIGYLTPDQNFYYVRVEGYDDYVFLMRRGLGERAFFGYDHFIDKTMAAVQPELVRHASLLRYGREPVLLMPNISPDETLLMPGMVMYEPVRGRDVSLMYFVEMVIAPAMHIQLGALVDLSIANPAAYGLDEPTMVISFDELVIGGIVGADGSLPTNRWQLNVGSRHNDSSFFYAHYEGIPHIFLIHEGFLQPFHNANFFLFINRFVSLIPIWLVDSITLETPDAHYEITMNHIIRGGVGDHEFRPDVNGELVQDAAFRWFYQHIAALAYEMLIDPYTPQDSPAVVITFHVNDDVPDGPIIRNSFYVIGDHFLAVIQESSAYGRDEYARFLVSRRNMDTMWRYFERLLAGELNR